MRLALSDLFPPRSLPRFADPVESDLVVILLGGYVQAILGPLPVTVVTRCHGCATAP